MRGGNGYIEDRVNSRLVRNAHLGVLWEGISNINALDVTTRAIAKVGPHSALADTISNLLDYSPEIPGQFRGELQNISDRAIAVAKEIARSGNELMAREASDMLYHATSAVLLARKGAALGATGGDARRLVMARMVVEHRLRPHDPLAIPADGDPAALALLGDTAITLTDPQRMAFQ